MIARVIKRPSSVWVFYTHYRVQVFHRPWWAFWWSDERWHTVGVKHENEEDAKQVCRQIERDEEFRGNEYPEKPA